MAQKYPQAILDSAISIVEGCTKIQPELSEELQILQIEGIDPGENILISATRYEASFYLATGDKRCLTALAAAPQLTEIKQRLIGRVVCLEQLILRLIYQDRREYPPPSGGGMKDGDIMGTRCSHNI